MNCHQFVCFQLGVLTFQIRIFYYFFEILVLLRYFLRLIVSEIWIFKIVWTLMCDSRIILLTSIVRISLKKYFFIYEIASANFWQIVFQKMCFRIFWTCLYIANPASYTTPLVPTENSGMETNGGQDLDPGTNTSKPAKRGRLIIIRVCRTLNLNKDKLKVKIYFTVMGKYCIVCHPNKIISA